MSRKPRDLWCVLVMWNRAQPDDLDCYGPFHTLEDATKFRRWVYGSDLKPLAEFRALVAPFPDWTTCCRIVLPPITPGDSAAFRAKEQADDGVTAPLVTEPVQPSK